MSFDSTSNFVEIVSRGKRLDIDIVSRYFSPWNGIEEDPVNGSSHTVLGVIYSEKLQKTRIISAVMSERKGLLHVEVPPPGASDRLFILGAAITVLRGHLSL